jgi:hypothetical protein
LWSDALDHIVDDPVGHVPLLMLEDGILLGKLTVLEQKCPLLRACRILASDNTIHSSLVIKMANVSFNMLKKYTIITLPRDRKLDPSTIPTSPHTFPNIQYIYKLI